MQSSTPIRLRGDEGMLAYLVRIRRESLGSGGPTYESVCALADDERAVLNLVKTALRLEDERVDVIRALSETEAQAIALKPFQVKRMT
jgi:hypothetical protein